MVSDYDGLTPEQPYLTADELARQLTLDEYNALTPFQQGYQSYIQAAWPGAEIPDGNPWPVGSTEGEQWFRGNYQAMIETQDVDDG